MEIGSRIHIAFMLLVIAITNSQNLPSTSPGFFPIQNFPARRIQLGPNTFLPRVGDFSTQEELRRQASVANNINLNQPFISSINPLTLNPDSVAAFQVTETGNSGQPSTSSFQGNPLFNPTSVSDMNPLFKPTHGSIANFGQRNAIAGSTHGYPGYAPGQRYTPRTNTGRLGDGHLFPGQTTRLFPPQTQTSLINTGSSFIPTGRLGDGHLFPGQTTRLFPPQTQTSLTNTGSSFIPIGRLGDGRRLFPGQTTSLFPPQGPTSFTNTGSSITGTGKRIALNQASRLQAVAVMQGFGSGVLGVITFTQNLPYRDVQVSGIIQNLPPGQHGMHVHELGDVSNGCDSAGGHFNPFNQVHGDRFDAIRHVGDLGNIKSFGRVTKFDFVDTQIQLTGGSSIIGRTIIIHALRDDLGRGNNEGSRTVGNSGARLACGIIGIARAEQIG